MIEYKCIHPHKEESKFCDKKPIGIIAYLDKRMLAGENDSSGSMAGMLSYLSGQDITHFSGKICLIPRLDIACTRYVVQTMYPMTSKEDTIEIENEKTGGIERTTVDENSNNIILSTRAFPEGGRKVVIDWMKKFKPKLKDDVVGQLTEWEEAFHAFCYVRPEMYQLRGVITSEVVDNMMDSLYYQYDKILERLESGTNLNVHPLEEIAKQGKPKPLPASK